MLHDPVLFENRIQHLQRTAAIHHEGFRNDFEPRAIRLPRKNVTVMRHAQPEADAIIGVSVECVRRHDVS